MQNQKFSIRDLDIKDIPQAMKLVLAEGWNQTPKDWELFINNPFNICKAATINKKLVGTTVTYHFSPELSWVSMVLVDKNFRGLGISKKLLESVLDELGECPLVKLDATEAGRNIYQKFDFTDEYRISRLICPAFNFSVDVQSNQTLKISQTDLPDIINIDNEIFGANRINLLDSWIKGNAENSWKLTNAGKTDGFTLGRQGNRFFQIGPVSARNTQDARILISQQLTKLQGLPLVIDVINSKTELLEWLYMLGFEKKREFTRMYKGANSVSKLYHNYFCIGGPEFG